MNIATLFKFRIGDTVRHCDSDRSTFLVTRRCPSLRVDARLDVDAEEGRSRFYELQEERPLFGQGKVGPVAEAELSPLAS